jgi:DNA-binding MarR family transcriptional regulator
VGDHVDRIVEQWARQRPDVDVAANALLARLLRATRFLEFTMSEVFARFEIGRAEFDVLASLRRAGPPFALSPSRLSEGLLLSTAAMTNRVDRLERLGNVRRRPDDRDRRIILVELTERGRELIDEVFPALVDEQERFLGSLSPKDRRMLDSLLRSLLLELESAPAGDASRRPNKRMADATGH